MIEPVGREPIPFDQGYGAREKCVERQPTIRADSATHLAERSQNDRDGQLEPKPANRGTGFLIELVTHHRLAPPRDRDSGEVDRQHQHGETEQQP